MRKRPLPRPFSRPRRAVVVAASAFLAGAALTACAVFESDPNPPPLFVDAGSSNHGGDAGHDATLDAPPDAHREAAHDAVPDVTAVPDAGDDARPDATKPVDAAPEAETPDAGEHETGVPDASSHDAKGDAGPSADATSDAAKRGYCAAVFATLAPLTFVACDDFDDDAGAYGNPTANNPPTTTLTVESTVFKSAPSAMRVSAQPSGAAVVISQVQFAVPVASSYVLQYDMKVDSFSVPANTTVLAAINFQNGALNEDVSLNFLGGGDAGPLMIGVAEVEPADGGKVGYKGHPNFAYPSDGAWHHVTLSFAANQSGNPWSYSLAIDTVPVDSNFLLPVFQPDGYGYASVGLDYAQGGGTRELYFDNILVEVR